MSSSPAFDIYSTGSVVEGFDEDEVVAKFAGLFKCPEDKARIFATSKKVIRKDVDAEMATTYASRLIDIGLDVELVPREAPEQEQEAANGGLSLTPVEKPKEQAPEGPKLSAAALAASEAGTLATGMDTGSLSRAKAVRVSDRETIEASKEKKKRRR